MFQFCPAYGVSSKLAVQNFSSVTLMSSRFTALIVSELFRDEKKTGRLGIYILWRNMSWFLS